MATKKNKKPTKKKTATRAATKPRTAAPPKKSKRAAVGASGRTSARKLPRRKTSAGKAPPKKTAQSAKSPAKRVAPPKPIRRQDRAGHLDPHYAATLRRQSGPKEHDPRAFLDRPRSPKDDLAEERGEEVIAKATSGEDEAEDSLDQVVPEERGGPFVVTNAAQEFAGGTDASNPKGAKREPFPRT